jgi:hypothetical protein
MICIWKAFLLLTPFVLVPSLLGEKKEGNKYFHKPVIGYLEGWKIEWDPEIAESSDATFFRKIRKALSNHFQRIKFLLPEDRVKVLQTLSIRVDKAHELSNMQYHPSKGWLINNGYDPALEKRVHIPRAENLLKRSTWQKHPYVILHELAHAYHDQILGFNHEEILSAYQRTEKGKLYERVLLFRGGKTKHYARTNHKEFFAEMTESYVGVNDFYPFVRAELKEHDPQTYALMEKIWGKF